MDGYSNPVQTAVFSFPLHFHRSTYCHSVFRLPFDLTLLTGEAHRKANTCCCRRNRRALLPNTTVWEFLQTRVADGDIPDLPTMQLHSTQARVALVLGISIFNGGTAPPRYNGLYAEPEKTACNYSQWI